MNGYEEVACPNKQLHWGGVQCNGPKNALLSGSSGPRASKVVWFYALGAYRMWQVGAAVAVASSSLSLSLSLLRGSGLLSRSLRLSTRSAGPRVSHTTHRLFPPRRA